MASLPEVYLARHGETAWTITGQHTGRTDIPLTARGEQNARSLRQRLNSVTFAKVLVSPLARARRTCELAGFGDTAEVAPELHEWDYGEYEGRRTVDIRQNLPQPRVSRPRIPAFPSPDRPLRAIFEEHLAKAGAAAHPVGSPAEAGAKLTALHPSAQVVCSAVPRTCTIRMSWPTWTLASCVRSSVWRKAAPCG